MLIVYVWDTGTWCGVTDLLEDAQEHVAARIGEDGQGRVEAARVVLGVLSLARCYERTGQAWQASRRRDGTVFWVSVERAPLRNAS